MQVKDLGAKPCHVPLAITPQPIEDHQATEKILNCTDLPQGTVKMWQNMADIMDIQDFILIAQRML